MAWFFVPLLLLLGATFLSAFAIALHRFGLISAKEEFSHRSRYYAIPLFLKRLSPKEGWENLFFLTSFSKQIARLCYIAAGCSLLLNETHSLHVTIITIAILILLPLLLDFCFRLLAKVQPKFIVRFTAPLASFYLLLFLPLTFLLLKIQRLFAFSHRHRHAHEPKPKLKEKILEIVHESEVGEELTAVEQKLITSVASFKDRIVREVMVPRRHVVSLPAEITVYEAAKTFTELGYSRIPVYKENVDQMIGVVHYKDLLGVFLDPSRYGDAHLMTVDKIAKPILYTPETKKISTLLTEFKQNQMHLAIVVDEYGGTEGIVSIEDILEELVGEIADEYDDSEKLFTILSDGSYLINAQMNIHDLEKEIGIAIPESTDYETVNGYIFHVAGSIPSIGFTIHHDNFDLEVMTLGERSIENVRIVPHQTRSH